MDRRLIERTIEIAHQSQAFGERPLRAALDSSPLWGAGRVEDTYNLIGHALKKAMRLVADQRGEELVEVGHGAGAEIACGSSLKAALDCDWDQVGQREIEARGCQFLFLPSYSPDLSPIEEAFSKLKAVLRQVGARTPETLQEAIGQALLTITPQDAQGWFRHCGYSTGGRETNQYQVKAQDT